MEKSRLCKRDEEGEKDRTRGSRRLTSIDYLTTLNGGAASSLRWYWLRRCRCSVSLTTSLTAWSIPRQQAWARWSEERSDVPATPKHKHLPVNLLQFFLFLLIFFIQCISWFLTICVFNDFVQQQRVLGESLHLRDQQVFELQPPTVTTCFTLLKQYHRNTWSRQLKVLIQLRVCVCVCVPGWCEQSEGLCVAYSWWAQAPETAGCTAGMLVPETRLQLDLQTRNARRR